LSVKKSLSKESILHYESVDQTLTHSKVLLQHFKCCASTDTFQVLTLTL